MRSGDRSAVLDLRPIKNNAWTCSPFVRWILAQKPHPPFTCESLLANCLPRESRERTRVVKWRTVGRKKHQLQPLALHDMLPRFLEVMTLSLHAFLPDRHLQQIASNTCAQLGSKRSNWQATRAIISKKNQNPSRPVGRTIEKRIPPGPLGRPLKKKTKPLQTRWSNNCPSPVGQTIAKKIRNDH